MYWRFVVKTIIYSLIADPAQANRYWKVFKDQQSGAVPFSDLYDGVEDDLKPLDTKLYSALVQSLRKHPKAVLLANKIQAKTTFGSGRQALAVFDRWFGHEIATLARRAHTQIMDLKCESIYSLDEYI